MRIHRVKIHPRYIDRIISGQKTFEIRQNDRDYQVGDQLSMYEHDPELKFVSSDRKAKGLLVEITYISTAYQNEDYCVLGIRFIHSNATEACNAWALQAFGEDTTHV